MSLLTSDFWLFVVARLSKMAVFTICWCLCENPSNPSKIHATRLPDKCHPPTILTLCPSLSGLSWRQSNYDNKQDHSDFPGQNMHSSPPWCCKSLPQLSCLYPIMARSNAHPPKQLAYGLYNQEQPLFPFEHPTPHTRLNPYSWWSQSRYGGLTTDQYNTFWTDETQL